MPKAETSATPGLAPTADQGADAPRPLLLLDGSGWLFRAFHGLPPLTNSQGLPTGMVFGMTTMLRRLGHDGEGDVLAVFDDGGKTFRHDDYADYKAHRPPPPPDLVSQFPYVRRLLVGLGWRVESVPGVEADDVIGTLALAAAALGRPVTIVTGDKDMAQLVGPQVVLLDTMKNRRMDEAGVVERFGVKPSQMVDFLALMGDASDNIPGIPGVGEKTAAKLLNEHQTLDGVVAASPKIAGKLGENIRAHLEQLPMARHLATIKADVALDFSLGDIGPPIPDREALSQLYGELEFHRLKAEIDQGGDGRIVMSTPAPARQVAPTGSAVSSIFDSLPPPPQPSPATTYRLVQTEVALNELKSALDAAPLVAFDTETDGLDSQRCGLVGLSFSVREGTGWYLPLAHRTLPPEPEAPPPKPKARAKKKSAEDAAAASAQSDMLFEAPAPETVPPPPAELPPPEQVSLTAVQAALAPWFADASRPKLAQNGKFDLSVLVRHGLPVAGLAHDTMLEHLVLAADRRHDMDSMADTLLGHATVSFDDIAGKGKKKLTFDFIPLETAAHYAAEDADITLRLHQRMLPLIDANPGLKQVYEALEIPLVAVLSDMEGTGVRVDATVLAELSAELAERIAILEAEATKAAHEAAPDHPFSISSPKQQADLLYNVLGLPVLMKTPKGEPSTAEDALEQLADRHPLPRLILDWRGAAKLKSTYTDSLPQQINPATGRIHTRYHQAGASTGRISSSDPNLQNIPIRTPEGRRIRKAFVADAGNLLLSADYSQVELRLMAHFSDDPKLISAFTLDEDVHRATASEVFGVALSEVTSDQRRSAKTINFGLIYGISAFGLAARLNLPRQVAQEYVTRFFARYPGVKRYMDASRESARTRGYVETLYGRRLYLREINSRIQGMRSGAERLAINAPLQGTAADLVKRTMIDLHPWLQAHAPTVRMLMQVHDELIFEGPADDLRQHAEAIAQRMADVGVLMPGDVKLTVPLVVDWGLGADWETASEGEAGEGSVKSIA